MDKTEREDKMRQAIAKWNSGPEVFFCAPSEQVCDPVDRPAHYRRFNVEVIDIIRHVLGEEGFRAYCIGNEVKYRLRAGFKNDGAEDLAKAMKYYEFRGGK